MATKTKKTAVGDELLTSLAEALDHARGKKVGVRVTNFDVPADRFTSFAEWTSDEDEKLYRDL